MNDREKALNCKTVLTIEPSRCQCFIEKPGATEEPPKQFTFDGAYFTHQSTEQMYNEIAYPLVEVKRPVYSTSPNSVPLCPGPRVMQ